MYAAVVELPGVLLISTIPSIVYPDSVFNAAVEFDPKSRLFPLAEVMLYPDLK